MKMKSAPVQDSGLLGRRLKRNLTINAWYSILFLSVAFDIIACREMESLVGSGTSKTCWGLSNPEKKYQRNPKRHKMKLTPWYVQSNKNLWQSSYIYFSSFQNGIILFYETIWKKHKISTLPLWKYKSQREIDRMIAKNEYKTITHWKCHFANHPFWHIYPIDGLSLGLKAVISSNNFLNYSILY